MHAISNDLPGAQKASILMLAVGEAHAAQLLGLLDQHEVLAISRSLASLGHVEASTVEGLLEEFQQRLSSTGGVSGGFAAAERLLTRSLGDERAPPILNAIRGKASCSVWEELAGVDDLVLASYLGNEHPQAVALILSRLETDQAARLLSHLPEDLATDIVLRLLRLETVEEEVVADIERTLRSELAERLAQAGSDNDGRMAAIFNQLDRSTETRLMQSLEAMNKEAADRIRALMFTFSDLARLDSNGVQMLIRTAGNDRLAVALKGAEEPLRELFFANMSERGGKMLREGMQAMGPVRLKDVEEAQQFLVNMAKELAASGQIELASGGEEEEMVY